MSEEIKTCPKCGKQVATLTPSGVCVDCKLENPTEKQLNVKVKVDDVAYKRMSEELASLKELEPYKELVEDMKERVSTELSVLGVPTEPQDIKSKAELERAIQTIKTLREAKKSKEPQSQIHKAIASDNPNAPWNEPKRQTEGFESYEAMITHLRKEAQRNDSEGEKAQEILDKLLAKAVLGGEQLKQPIVYEEKDSVMDYLHESEQPRTVRTKEGIEIEVKPKKKKIHRDSRIKIEKER